MNLNEFGAVACCTIAIRYREEEKVRGFDIWFRACARRIVLWSTPSSGLRSSFDFMESGNSWVLAGVTSSWMPLRIFLFWILWMLFKLWQINRRHALWASKGRAHNECEAPAGGLCAHASWHNPTTTEIQMKFMAYHWNSNEIYVVPLKFKWNWCRTTEIQMKFMAYHRNPNEIYGVPLKS